MKNLAAYGSFEKAAAPVEVRRNLAINPRGVSGTGWNNGGYGTGGVATQTYPADAGIENDFGSRIVWTTAATGGGSSTNFNATFATVNGAQYVASLYVRSNQDLPDVSLVGTTGTGFGSTARAIPRNTWVRLSAPFVGNGGSTVTVSGRINYLTGTTNGLIWEVTRVLIEQTDQLRPYFDGATTNTSNTSYTWAGAVNNSASIASSNLVEVQRNLAPFGSFEAGVAGTTEVRRNLATDPRAVQGNPTTGQVGWGNQWFGSGGGSGTTTLVVNAGDGPQGLGITSYRRKTWTAAPLQNIDTGFWHSGSGTSAFRVTPGVPYTVSVYLRSSKAKRVRMRLDFYDALGNSVAGEPGAAAVNMADGQWTRISSTSVIPATAVYLRAISYLESDSYNPVWAPGDTLDGTALLVEQTDQLRPYFDGSSELSGFSFSWAGTPNASASIARAATTPVLTNLAAYGSFETAQGGTTEVRRNLFGNPSLENSVNTNGFSSGSRWSISNSSETARTGSRSIRIVRNSTTSGNGYIIRSIDTVPGASYVFSAYIYGGDASANPLGNHSIRFGAVVQRFAASPGAWSRVSVSGVASSSTTDLYITDDGSSNTTSWVMYIDDMLLEQTDQLRPYFDGSSPNEKGFTTEWSGTANASASVMRAATVSVRENYATNPHAVSGGVAWSGQTPTGNIVGFNATGAQDGGSAWQVETTQTGQVRLAAPHTLPFSASAVGATVTAAIDILAPVATTAYFEFQMITGGGNNFVRSQNVDLVVGWNRPVLKWTVPTGTTAFATSIQMVTGSVSTTGVWRGSRLYVVPGDASDSYFDGSAGNSGDFINAWTGAANASTSVQQVVPFVAFTASGNNTFGYLSYAWVGRSSLRLTPSTANADSFASPGGDIGALRLGMQAGKTYTIVARIRLSAPLQGSINIDSGRRIVVYTKVGAANYVSTASNQASNAAGETLCRITVTIPSGATEAFVRLYNGASAGNGDVWWDEFTVVEGNHPDLMPFDGSSVSSDPDLWYAWTGTPFASTSEYRGTAVNLGNAAAYESRAYWSAGRLAIAPLGINRPDPSIENAVDPGIFNTHRVVTVAAWVTLTEPQAGTSAFSRTLRVNSAAGGLTASNTVTPPNTAGRHLYRTTVSLSSGATVVSTYLYNGDGGSTRPVYWDDLTVVAGNHPNLMPYNGSSPDSGDFTNAWDGMPFSSPSQKLATRPLGTGVTTNSSTTRPMRHWRSSFTPNGVGYSYAAHYGTDYGLMYVRLTPNPTVAGDTISISFNYYNGSTVSHTIAVALRGSAPQTNKVTVTPGWGTYTTTFTNVQQTTPTVNVEVGVEFSDGATDLVEYVHNITVVKGTYSGPPFHGGTFYGTWDGTPYESTSQKPLPALSYWDATRKIEDWVQAQILP